MDAPVPDEVATLAKRIVDSTTRLRQFLQTRKMEEALAAARNRQSDIEALCALALATPTPPIRELLEAALREGHALEPEIMRVHALAAEQLQQFGRRLRASAEYRVLTRS